MGSPYMPPGPRALPTPSSAMSSRRILAREPALLYLVCCTHRLCLWYTMLGSASCWSDRWARSVKSEVSLLLDSAGNLG